MRCWRCWSSAVGDAWRAIAPEGAGAAWAPLPRSPAKVLLPDSVTSALQSFKAGCALHCASTSSPLPRTVGHCSPAAYETPRWSRGCPPRPTQRTAVGDGRDAHGRPAVCSRLRRAVSAHDQAQRLWLATLSNACAALPDGHAPTGSTVAGPKSLHSPRTTPTRHYQQLQRPSLRARNRSSTDARSAAPSQSLAALQAHLARVTAPQSRCAGTGLR
jgi:hypothetical protein